MYKPVTTLTDFVLEEERRNKNATGNFTMLFTHIENAVKIIASHVRMSGLVDIMGATGAKNVFGEEVQKLDEFANKLMVDNLRNSGHVYAVISEEMEHPAYAKEGQKGAYVVFIDPLDGSSNIDTNCPTGTIFSIYKTDGDNLLQPGSKQVAAGYAIYGSSAMLVYSAGNGVNGFTLDPNIGSFLLSHPNIKIPQKGKIYSINEGYDSFYDEGVKSYLAHLKENGGYTARYVGSGVADAHRTLIKGGIFLYPANKKQKEGKLRLMLEVNPFAFLVEQAGGMAVGFGKESPLAITPTKIHERCPLVMGSREDVELYTRYG
jgi:fructose-1,6-bisphosphatase I